MLCLRGFDLYSRWVPLLLLRWFAFLCCDVGMVHSCGIGMFYFFFAEESDPTTATPMKTLLKIRFRVL